jgi:hypothetical protein
LYFDNSFPGKRASGECFLRVWVNHRADLVSVAKSVDEGNASKWESDKRKERSLKTVEKIYSTGVLDVF